MIRHRLIATLGLIGFLCALPADASLIITVDENGSGTFDFQDVFTAPLTGILTNDPGPGGLHIALTYDLLGPQGLVAGDALIFDEDGTTLSDILRFNPAGTGDDELYPASAVFYSLSGGIFLADTGFPTAFYPNTLQLIETNGGVTFTPNFDQPGFVPGFDVTYVITSDAPIPEPASPSLLLAGLGFLGVRRLRRRSRMQATAQPAVRLSAIS